MKEIKETLTSDLDVPCGATDASQRSPSVDFGFKWFYAGNCESLRNHCQQQLVALSQLDFPDSCELHRGASQQQNCGNGSVDVGRN